MAAGKSRLPLDPSDEYLRYEWRATGGVFTGETGTMPEWRLLLLLRTYVNAVRAMHEQAKTIKRLEAQVAVLRERTRITRASTPEIQGRDFQDE